MSIKDKLRLLRLENNGLSQEQAALDCGISLSLWQKLEQGVLVNPRLDTLVKIAAHFQKSLDWLTDYYPDWRMIFRRQ